MKKDFSFSDAIADFRGIELMDIEEGTAQNRIETNGNHMNCIKMPHGAALFTIEDVAFAAAANYRDIPSEEVTIHISYLKKTDQNIRSAVVRKISEKRQPGAYQVRVAEPKGDVMALFDGMTYRKFST